MSTMETLKTLKDQYLVKNIAIPLGLLSAFVLSAFLFYKIYYYGPNAAAFTQISPAAGETVTHENGVTYIPIDYRNIPVWPGPDWEER